jgi:hypothetical protein
MVSEGAEEDRDDVPMKAEARGGCSATKATNGKVVACNFCAAISKHKWRIGEEKNKVRTTPSFTFPNIATPNDKSVLVKEFDESGIR